MHLIKNFLMTLKRFYVSSLLNIIGLAVAFTTAYLIMVQVRFDFTYNKSIPDNERIFVLETKSQYDEGKYSSCINRHIGETFSRNNPTVECYGIMPPNGVYYSNIIVRNGEESKKHSVYGTRATLGGLEAVGMKVVSGDLSKFSDPKTIIISESTAKRLGAEIGSLICFGDVWDINNTATLVAIYEDFPKNSDYKNFEAIFDYGDDYINDLSEWSFHYIVKLNSAADKDRYLEIAKNNNIDYLKSLENYSESDIEDINNTFSRFRLMPINETYFSPDSQTGVKGNITTTYTLFAIAILVIVIAFINFINFFMAMVPQRLHGVNTYRVYGCSLSQMRWNFIFESTGLALMALCLAVIFIVAVQDSMIREFISTSIFIKDNGGLLIAIVATGLVFAVFAGIYPAFYITSFPLALAAKGRFGASKSGKRLRYTLVGIQFIISISLIVCSIFIKLQHDYMMRYNMGFNKEMLITGNLPSKIGNKFDDRETFTSELKKNVDILDVTYANGKLVAPGRMGWGREFKGKNINFQCYPVAYNFLDFMGIDIVEGRDFSMNDEHDTTGVFIFNESARDEFELTLEDKIYGHCAETGIVGFCKNFNYKPLQYKVTPFSFYIFGPNGWKSLNHIYFRVAPNADIDKIIEFVKDEAIKYSPTSNREDLSFDFFDEELGKEYYQEKKLTTLISLFSLISIIISLMGVFGLVLFETQYSRKEIAVRRVNGATVKEILSIFNKHFVRIILICFVISVPICYYIVDSWLKGFAYRTPIYWWVFAIALLIVMTITIGIVVVRSCRAANANPVESLKNE